jgi:hypothetical protein
MHTQQQEAQGRAIRGMFFRNWLTLRWGLMPLIIIWFLLIWVFGWFQGEVILAAMYLTLSVGLCSAIGGFDQLTGEGEYRAALPPTRKQRYWFHFLPGFAIVLFLTTATFLTYAWNLPQLLWGTFAGGVITTPYHAGTFAEYGMLFLGPLYAYYVAHAILMNSPSVLTDPRTGFVLRWNFLFIPCATAWSLFLWCSYIEQQLWPGLLGIDPLGSDQVFLGIITLPVFAILTPFLLWRGATAQRRREATHASGVRLLGLSGVLFFSSMVLMSSGLWGVNETQDYRPNAFATHRPEWGLLEFTPPTALRWLAIIIILAAGPTAVLGSWRYFNGSWRIPPIAERKKRLIATAASLTILILLGLGVVIADRAALNDYKARANMTVLVPKETPIPPQDTEELYYYNQVLAEEWIPVSMNLLAYSREDGKPLWGKTIIIESPGKQEIEFRIGGTTCVFDFYARNSGWRKRSINDSTDIQFICYGEAGFLRYKSRQKQENTANSHYSGSVLNEYEATFWYDVGGNFEPLSLTPASENVMTCFKIEVFPCEEDVKFTEISIRERIAAGQAAGTLPVYPDEHTWRPDHQKLSPWFGATLPAGFLLFAAVALLCSAQRHRPFLTLFFASWILLAPIAAHHYVVRVNEHRIATSNDPFVRDYAEQAIQSSLFTDRTEE